MNPQEPNAEQSSNQSPPAKRPTLLIALGLLLLVIVIAGTMQLTKKQNNSEPAVKQAKVTRTANVTITADGMQPDTLLVSVGTQVTWTNDDSTVHQVAADPYPQDNSIPGFNNQAPLNKGDTYSFNFTKAGTYHYHDEKNPLNIKGTVTVR